MRNSTLRLAPLFAAAAIVIGACTSRAPALTEGNRADIRRTIEAYRMAWLRGSADDVLSTFTTDAVLLPHHGDAPVVGADAIRRHWFPPGPPTVIDGLDITVEEIDGDGLVAFARGTDRVRWSTSSSGTTTHLVSAGTYLNAMRKGPDGHWRIRVHMWDDPPVSVE
jgi:ketosteroid isomerase-like protein